jgi:hypothetical protein
MCSDTTFFFVGADFFFLGITYSFSFGATVCFFDVSLHSQYSHWVSVDAMMVAFMVAGTDEVSFAA